MVAVSKALDLSPGATSKRWSRLKQAMEQGKYPSAGSYGFLWLCVKHSTRDKVGLSLFSGRGASLVVG